MKLVCQIPGCAHYTNRFKDATERSVWICGVHWRTIPRQTRAHFKKLQRIYDRSPADAKLVRTEYIRAWDALESAAIEAACGL